ncbi:uncharacterized protein LOC128955985 [Oppia nitens]|uniref:uncharacterized protein LOC128955985 n=2 Tax=Oppia nitens TaxID=1686743 RepID=UPI0023DAC84E|nr:uncharacterized protein LOC128955985 [Oppia nitens]
MYFNFLVIIIGLIKVVFNDDHNNDDFCEKYINNYNSFDFALDDTFRRPTDEFREVVIGNYSWPIYYDRINGNAFIGQHYHINDFKHKFDVNFLFDFGNKGIWRAFYKKDLEYIVINQLGSNDFSELRNQWKGSDFTPTVAFSSLEKLMPIMIMSTDSGNGYNRQAKIYSWNTYSNEFIEVDPSYYQIPIFIAKLNPRLHLDVILSIYHFQKFLVIFDDPYGPKYCVTKTNMTEQECDENNIQYLVDCHKSDITTTTITTTETPSTTITTTSSTSMTTTPSTIQTTSEMTESETTSTTEMTTITETETPITQTLTTITAETETTITKIPEVITSNNTTNPTTNSTQSLESTESMSESSIFDNSYGLPIFVVLIFIIILIISALCVFSVYYVIKRKSDNSNKTLNASIRSGDISKMPSFTTLGTINTIDSTTGSTIHIK